MPQVICMKNIRTKTEIKEQINYLKKRFLDKTDIVSKDYITGGIEFLKWVIEDSCYWCDNQTNLLYVIKETNDKACRTCIDKHSLSDDIEKQYFNGAKWLPIEEDKERYEELNKEKIAKIKERSVTS